MSYLEAFNPGLQMDNIFYQLHSRHGIKIILINFMMMEKSRVCNEKIAVKYGISVRNLLFLLFQDYKTTKNLQLVNL